MAHIKVRIYFRPTSFPVRKMSTLKYLLRKQKDSVKDKVKRKILQQNCYVAGRCNKNTRIRMQREIGSNVYYLDSADGINIC